MPHYKTLFDYPIHGGISIAAGVCTTTLGNWINWFAPSVSTPGNYIQLNISDQVFTFNDDSHASSHLTNLGFGITEAADWDVDMPFFLYLVNEDDTLANIGCFFSRDPRMTVTPAADYIHDKTAAAANDTKNSIFGMWADDAGKAAKPCSLIGCFRMRWATGTDDWTVQAISGIDGIGEDALSKSFGSIWTMPDQQNGANATVNNYLNCTNTPPVWATPANTIYYYSWDRQGWINVVFNTSASGVCTNGTNTDDLSLCLPIMPLATYYSATPNISAGLGAINASPSTLPDDMIAIRVAAATHNGVLATSLNATIQADDFSDAADDLCLAFRYKAF